MKKQGRKYERNQLVRRAGQAVPLLLIGSLLGGCAGNSAAVSGTESTETESGAQTPENTENTQTSQTDSLFETDTLFSDRDFDAGYDEEESVRITLNGDSASCDSDDVEISGQTVTIKDAGVYIISGTLENGMIIVDADEADKVQIVLENAKIHSETFAAVYVRQADKVFLSLPAGTENTLSNGGVYEAIDENNIDAVVFSKADLTLQGAGALTIAAEAGHGVVSKDSLTITGGTYVVNAAEHGFSGKDDICIAGGSFTVTAGKDGIHAENKDDEEKGFLYIKDGVFQITADGDAVSAGSDAQIDGGTFILNAGGGAENGGERQESGADGFGGRGGAQDDTASGGGTSSVDGVAENSPSTKGIKSGGHLLINGGTFSLDSADDAVHSVQVTVNGGTFEILTGDDGVHADETLLINGGVITISQSYEGLEGLSVEITGGEIDIMAGDDGINAADGSAEGFGGRTRPGIWGTVNEAVQPGVEAQPGGEAQPVEGTEQSGVEAQLEDGTEQPGEDAFQAQDNAESQGESDIYIRISGGKITVNAISGDGLDSNGDLEITGGEVYVSAAEQGPDVALDYDGEGSITGGTLVAVGSVAMLQSVSSDAQGVICTTVEQTAAGGLLELTDGDGTVLTSWTPPKSYSAVIVSSPSMTADSSYTLKTGDAETEIALEGLSYTNGAIGQRFGAPGRRPGGGGGQFQPPADLNGKAPAEGMTPPADLNGEVQTSE